MKNIFLFFLFFFIINITYVYSDSVNIISNISDQNLGCSLTSTLPLKAYASGFNYVTVNYNFYGSANTHDVILDIYQQEGLIQCNGQDIYACLIGHTDDVHLIFKSNCKVGTSRILVVVSNYSTNGTLYDWKQFDFNVTTSNINSVSGSNKSDFVDVWISNVYPNHEELSTTAKFSYYFLSVLFVTFSFYILVYLFTKSIHPVVHYIALIFNVVLFFFFISIGYVPVGVIIVIVLILATVTYFRVKSGHPA